MIDHTIHAFDVDLQELTRKVADMGSLAEQQITDAFNALVKRDTALAKRVVSIDTQIDALQHEIEQKAVVTLARRQPVGVDLREVVGALRMSNDLERIGDLAENIAKRVIMLDGLPSNEPMLQMERMVNLVLNQLQHVFHSYAHHDVAEALEVWRRDQEVDAMNNSLFRELLTYMMESPHYITMCAHLLFCAKNLERMGDHATNIAETIYYIVEGRPLLEDRPKADITSIQELPLGV